MNIYYISNSKVISLIFIICLLIPNISFSDAHNDSHQAGIEATQQLTSTGADSKQASQGKEILSGDRELGTFFLIGLIINLIMMTSFAVWAIGQWRQNNKKKK